MLSDKELGKGIKLPVQLDGKSDLASVEGDELLQCNVELLLGIERGELEWDMEAGPRFREMLHQKMPVLIQGAIANRETTDQINRYEPHAWAAKAVVSKGDSASSLFVSLTFRRRSSLDEQSQLTGVVKVGT